MPLRRPYVARTASLLATGTVGRRGDATGAQWAADVSLDMDGTTMYVDISGAEDGFTWSGTSWIWWMKLDAKDSIAEFVNFGENTNGYPFVRAFNTNNVATDARIYAVDDANSPDISGLNEYPVEAVWQQIIVSWASAGITVYVNGVAQATYASFTPGAYTGWNRAYIGVLKDASPLRAWFPGNWLEWAQVGQTIDGTEATEAYNSGAPFDLRDASFGANVDDYVVMSVYEGTSSVTFPNQGNAPNFADASLVNGDSADLVADTP